MAYPLVGLGTSNLMSQSNQRLATRPNIKLVTQYGVDNSEVTQHARGALSGAELDELMDNQFKHMFDVLSDGLFYMSDKQQIFFYNPSFYNQFNIQSGYADLQSWMDLVHPIDRHMLESRVEWHLQQEGAKLSTQYRVKRSDGQYIWIEGTAIVRVKNGQHYLIGCHRDISDTKLMETYIQQSAFHDDISGLSNANKLALDIADIRQTEHDSYSLIYLQIDDIKSYLNLYGPQILSNLVNILIDALHTLPDNFVDIYRVRSDDFIILVKGDYLASQLMVLGERILKHYKQSIESNGFMYGTDISVGVYPSFDLDMPTDEVIKVASRTCQYAGERNRAGIAVYSGRTKAMVDRFFFIERELNKAIKDEQLSVKFQPIICAQTNQVASFEALVRWKSSEIGEIYPDEFIAVAEKKGLIIELGYFVYDKACRFIQRYQATHNKQVRVNVNVSVLQLLNLQFPEKVKLVADQHGINTQNIVLELTETIILDGNKSAQSQLKKLSEHGFRLSLDDFGSGYSSLNSFFDLPLNQIKVDKSIAWRSVDNPATYEYLKFITQLCKDHSVDIVIEGIESADMQRTFTEMGVSYLQGYWFSKPLSLASASQYTLV